MGAGESIAQRVGNLFDIPLDRLKLIRHGQLLITEEQMVASATGAPMQILGTPACLQTPVRLHARIACPPAVRVSEAMCALIRCVR